MYGKVLILCFAFVTLAHCYSTEFDHLDIEKIIRDPQDAEKYVGCLTGNSECSPSGQFAKNHLPEVIATCCSKCNLKQRDSFRKAIRYMEIRRPQVFTTLMSKVDPHSQFKSKCSSFYSGR